MYFVFDPGPSFAPSREQCSARHATVAERVRASLCCAILQFRRQILRKVCFDECTAQCQLDSAAFLQPSSFNTLHIDDGAHAVHLVTIVVQGFIGTAVLNDAVLEHTLLLEIDQDHSPWVSQL